MKIALVYDRVNKFGGAEQVLLALHSIWPDAPLYTSVYANENAEWAKDFRVIPSFLQRIPFAKHHHELYPWLTPLAFESFSFDQYDVVISVTSAEAKSIITKPETLHICYCLTPTRYLWSGYETYRRHPGLGKLNRFGSRALHSFIPTLRYWDTVSSSRPDYYVAISTLVKERIETYYHREVSEVIYPPVNTDIYTISEKNHKDYYLVVARLVGYKRLDIIIEAFNRLQLPLVIIGNGYEYNNLKKMGGKTIQFVTQKLTDEKLTEYYQQCKAFVYAAEEDFGIVAAEAQSCGRPVIAYYRSGVADIVLDKKTGILFPEQTVESLIEALTLFQTMKFDPSVCRSRALQFSQRSFEKDMLSFVKGVYNKKFI